MKAFATLKLTCEDTGVLRYSQSLLVLFALVSIATPGVACTFVLANSATVGPNFDVKVSGLGSPAPGLPLQLYKDGVVTTTTVTGKDGVALFRNVAPGSYILSADHDAGIGGGAYIEVRRSASSKITVPLRWPNATPLSVAEMKGVLHLPDWMPGQTRGSIPLALLEGFSGKVLSNANTDENGAFEFPRVVRGFYFLKLPDGLIPVTVDPGASPSHLDLDVGLTSCGLYYTNQSDCPHASLHLERLEGRVVDVTGGAISQAEILLIDRDGNLVQRERSDRAGDVGPLRPPDGAYELIVRDNGFTTLHGSLTFDSSGASSRLEFQLGVAGSCSLAKIQ